MRKILLVSGCSNTDKDFFSDIHPEMNCSWPKWPEILAKKLDMECVNLGKCGQGNEYIYHSLLEYITNAANDPVKRNGEAVSTRNTTSNIGLVIPAWTQCQRKDFTQGKAYRWTNVRIDPNGDVFWWMKKYLNLSLSLQILCERYEIPLLQVNMLEPYQDWLSGLRPRDNDVRMGVYDKTFRYTYPGNPEEDNKKIIKIINDFEDKIDGKKFLGWPLYKEMGGYSLQDKLIGFAIKKPGRPPFDTKLSKFDDHPNATGHREIAEFIYDRLG
tara:strand:- start:403 stop:1215 length:813 start_codon:yes stop_codon:yes gene_type:complete